MWNIALRGAKKSCEWTEITWQWNYKLAEYWIRPRVIPSRYRHLWAGWAKFRLLFFQISSFLPFNALENLHTQGPLAHTWNDWDVRSPGLTGERMIYAYLRSNPFSGPTEMNGKNHSCWSKKEISPYPSIRSTSSLSDYRSIRLPSEGPPHSWYDSFQHGNGMGRSEEGQVTVAPSNVSP